MGLSINLENLSSRTARKEATGNAIVRRFALNGTGHIQQEDGGIAGIYNAINKFGNSLMAATLNFFKNIIQWSATRLWQFCVSAGMFLLNFNWNISDKELDDQIKQGEIAIGAARGALKGKTVGYAVCGLIPTATIAVFNEPMALHILETLGEEAAEEIAQSLTNLINLQMRQWGKTVFANLYKNYRSILRPAALGIAQLLVNIGIFTQESVDKANKKRNEPWSFAGALDDSVESIKDPVQRAEAEEFWENFGEACIEAGYIVAGGIDSYLVQQKIAHDKNFGAVKTIELIPDRSEENNNVTNS